MASRAESAVAHDRVVVPAGQRSCQWGEQIHLRSGGSHVVVVPRDGQTIVASNLTAADAFKFTIDPPLEQARWFDASHTSDESQMLRQHAHAGATSPGPQAAGVTVLEADNAFDVCSPARLRPGVKHRIPYAI
jgi:hypothetical protein